MLRRFDYRLFYNLQFNSKTQILYYNAYILYGVFTFNRSEVKKETVVGGSGSCYPMIFREDNWCKHLQQNGILKRHSIV